MNTFAGNRGQVLHLVDVECGVACSPSPLFQVIALDRAMRIPVVLDNRQTYLARSANGTLEVFNFLVALCSRSSIDTVIKARDHHVAYHQAARLELVDNALQVRLLPGHLWTTHQNVIDAN